MKSTMRTRTYPMEALKPSEIFSEVTGGMVVAARLNKPLPICEFATATF